MLGEIETLPDDKLSMEYERCYVLHPKDARPVKRRLTVPQGLQASWRVRRRACRTLWHQQHESIKSQLSVVNVSTATDLTKFLDESFTLTENNRIPTGIIQARPNATSSTSRWHQLSAFRPEGIQRTVISLWSDACSNLKAALKALNQKCTARICEEDDDQGEMHTSPDKGRKLLHYDLELLRSHVQANSILQVVVVFEDIEAFDSDLLSALIELLSLWRGRIPFVFLFSLRTSVSFLEQRLSNEAIKCLDGRLFSVAPTGDEIEGVFKAFTHDQTRLWIGPNVAGLALDRDSGYISSVGVFTDVVQYSHMSHFYANALSIFLITGLKLENVPQDHFEALRGLDSFRDLARQLLDNHETMRLQDLINSDEILLGFVCEKIGAAQVIMNEMMIAIKVIQSLETALTNTSTPLFSSLYVRALSGSLSESAGVRSLLMSVKKAPSDVGCQLLDSLLESGMPAYYLDKFADLAKQLRALVEAASDSSKLFRSDDDTKHSSVRTTVVAQQVELSKHKSTLSNHDATYTAIIRRFTETLERYFAEKLVNPRELVFHEIFIYDLRLPHRLVITPCPRHAIERALAASHDYLDCMCCSSSEEEDDEGTLLSTQPASAILYQLFLESGNFINTGDLWTAFQAVIGRDGSEEAGMALFQRALAELRYLGFVKTTRKRVDHVAKSAWKGL